MIVIVLSNLILEVINNPFKSPFEVLKSLGSALPAAGPYFARIVTIQVFHLRMFAFPRIFHFVFIVVDFVSQALMYLCLSRADIQWTSVGIAANRTPSAHCVP